MNYKDTEQLTMNAVKQYYEGNSSLFFECLHPDVVVLSIGKSRLCREIKW